MNRQRESVIIFLIIILLPVFKITEFYYNYLSSRNVQFAAYSLIIIFLLLFLLNNKQIRIILFFVVLYYLAYILLPSTLWNNNASQAIPFVLTIALLITYSYYDIVFSKKYVDYLLLFTFLYVTLFFLSVLLNGLTVLNNRLYLDGFVISHSFSYTIIALGIFVYTFKNKSLGFILISLSALVGARSGILLFLLTVAYIFFDNVKSLKKIISFTIILAMIALIIVGNFDIPVLYSSLDTFKNLDWGSFNLFGTDKYSSSFTASRSTIWYNTFIEFSQNFSLNELIFGRGPLSPFSFTESIGLGRIWLHNDFFNIVYAYGILGIVLYLWVLIKYLIKTKSFYALAYIFAAAFSNGFYYYDTPLILTIFSIIMIKHGHK